MGKTTVYETGNVRVKMDTKDSDYSDKKDPHVSIVLTDGTVLCKHFYLESCDGFVGSDGPTKKAVYWIRDNKEKLIERYNKEN